MSERVFVRPWATVADLGRCPAGRRFLALWRAGAVCQHVETSEGRFLMVERVGPCC